MENGTGLCFQLPESSPSAAIIVRKPLSKKYYIFNSGERINALGDVFYSIIDMEANNGNGKVITKRQLLVKTSAEKIALVQHANKRDIWIAIKQGYSDTLFIFLLTPNGISPSVLKFNTYQEKGGTGQMKFSPNAKYLAFGNVGNQPDTCCYIYNFNNRTGAISNQRKVHVISYCIEFSPNSKYLYIRSGYGKLGLHQYPIKNIKTDMWPDSSCFYLNFRMGFGALQLAPNGKIYGNSYDTMLRVINFPNLKGAYCNYQNLGQKFLDTTKLLYQNYKSVGLPSFMTSYLRPQSFTIASHCINRPTQFVLLDSLDNDSIKWDFGDTLSHEKNFSNKTQDISHVYVQYGEYTVRLITFYDNKSDTITEVVRFVNPKPNFTASDVCENDTVKFFDKSSVSVGKLDLYWKFGDGQYSILRSPSHFYQISGVSKTYNVTLVAKMADGCADSITRPVTVNANPKSDFNFTINQNTVDFKPLQPGNTTYQWNLGNGDSALTKDVTYVYPKSGKYSVCLKTINAANCNSKTCKEVSIALGISNTVRQLGFKIYPNPNSGSFTIEKAKNKEIATIEITNQIGQILHKAELSDHLNTIDLNLNNGVYLIRMTIGENSLYERIVVNK
jgi:PKD repeat protein